MSTIHLDNLSAFNLLDAHKKTVFITSALLVELEVHEDPAVTSVPVS